MTCGFTGPYVQDYLFLLYRDDPAYISLRQRLEKEIILLYEQGVTDFYCAMTHGADRFFAELVLDLREVYLIKLHGVVAFRDQLEFWTGWPKQYANLLPQCDSVAYLHEAYQPGCCRERNLCVVDRADILLAVCDPENMELRSGTGTTVRYARTKKRRIVFVLPA